MTLITTRDLIRGVAEKWAAQYSHNNYRNDVEKQKIGRQLKAMDAETADSALVKSIIGNDSWTSLVCDECDEHVSAVVEVGAEPDYESATAKLCFDCVNQAAELIKGK